MYKIAVIPGDGTGPEVVREGLKVLEAAGNKFNFKYETKIFDFGGERYLKTGENFRRERYRGIKKILGYFSGGHWAS